MLPLSVLLGSHRINKKIVSSQGRTQNNMRSSSVIPAIQTNYHHIIFEDGVCGTVAIRMGLQAALIELQQSSTNPWLPTIVYRWYCWELDKDKWKLDGYNVWSTITTNRDSPHKEILSSPDPPRG